MSLVKHNNNSISAVTSMANLSTGAMTLIKEITASSDASISFVDGSNDVVLDSTYPIYKFEFINMHPASDDVKLQFQADTGTNTNYNQTITSTFFQYYHLESDSASGGGYVTSLDQAQGTAFQTILNGIGNDNDQNANGTIQIFNPSSSVFVKHFIATGNRSSSDNASVNEFCAGYFNLTTALTRFRFKMSSGNIDSGTIKLYGIKDS